MFQKKETESNYDIIIGPSSLIKGDIESEGSIRIDGKIFGNIKSLGNVIISENANVKGDIYSVNAEIYGKCEGNVQVKGKINIHQNSTLIGDIVAKSFNTKEGSFFKGNCIVDPAEELVITIDSLINPPQNETNLVDFSKSNPNERNKNRNDKEKEKEIDKQIESKKA
jgi:cytoskeletal protein CcmA (bactofilin family)